jgi:cytochrome oxidase Cu insertion factor (SCO1/SenC/PrrC family)
MNKRGITLTLLGLLFFGPMLFATFLYFKADAFNIKLGNTGELINPSLHLSKLKLEDFEHQPLQIDTLKGKWWLVYLSPEQCYNACHDILFNMRQIKTALGRETDRVERLVLAPKDRTNAPLIEFIESNYPDIKRALILNEDYDQYFAPLGDPKDRAALGELVIIDPKGQIVLYYDGDTPPKGILTDLRRLLKISQIG